MHALLDTHALLWWLTDDFALTKPARKVIGNATNAILVTVAGSSQRSL
jgi:PIN domain nuclease of toxin-antitoxin system